MLNTHDFLVARANNHHQQDLSGINFAWLEITQKCNLQCIHCYADSSPEVDLHGQMTKDYWLRVISELAALGCKKIQFIGGEPMLHPSLEEFIGHARDRGIHQIEVFTNSTTVNKRWIDFFLANAVMIATSYYASSESMHEQITTKHGSYRKTSQGLAMLVNAGVPVRVEIIDIRGINSDSLAQTESNLRDGGIDSIRIDQVRNIGRGKTCGDQPQKSTCGNCWNRKVCITSTGVVFPCVMSRTNPLGNVLQMSLDEIANSESTLSFRSNYKEQRVRLASCSPSDDCSPDNGACGPDNCSPNDAGEDCGPDTR